jgi:histidyl-tRNA synthetase
MGSKIQAPKGTVDALPADIARWQTVEQIARDVAELYDFREIRTPIFEHTELFHRGVGETSDIVSKETYTFEDRGGRSITLRPEGTAGVVRAMIEHNILADQGARSKVYYIGPNFRYENVQKGRVRQHHQFGVEAFGVAEPEQDVECILLQMDFYRRCGVKDLSLQVNTLGDRESKEKYRDALVKILEPVSAELSGDSVRRLGTNPLRILDSKDPRDQAVFQKVALPASFEFLSAKSLKHWERVIELLKQSNASFQPAGNLVRGFDYYTDTLWEVTAGGLGSQNAIGGGGRYDNLVEELGGRATPAVGFGSGLERLLIALEAQNVSLPSLNKPLVWIITQGESAKAMTWQLLADLRAAGVSVDMDLSGRSVKSQFKLADREHAAFCVIVGDTEAANQTAILKDMKTSTQTTLSKSDLIAKLSNE